MKQTLIFFSFICLTLFSCKKDTTPTSLSGKWRMVAVKDNVSGQTTTKESSIQGDVVITFSPSNSTIGTFIGNTPTNDIWKNDYSIGVNQTIAIPALAMTKVAETSWGELFVDNIRSSQQYTFSSGELLNIKTTNKTLILLKE